MNNKDLFGTAEKIAVLLTPGFAEGTAVLCMEQFRDAGLPVSLIGMNDQLIRGSHGIKVEPDCTIEEIPSDTPYRLIILSGGRQSINTSLIDPRVIHLLQQTIETQGYIAPIARAQEFLRDAGFPEDCDAPYIVSQNGKTAEEYVQQLIKIATLEQLQPDYQH